MNFVFDLDNTILKCNMSKIVFKKHNMEWYSAINWGMTNYPDPIKQEIISMFKTDAMIHKDVFPKAIELIQSLKVKGHTVTIVTARDKCIEQKTKDLVRELFDVDCIVTGFNESKLKILQDLKCDVWIDDSPEQILEVYNADIICILISNDETIYNHYLRDQITWVESVEDIYNDFEFEEV